MGQQEFEKALRELLVAKELDPDNPQILNHLGLAYYFQKEYEHAIISLKSSIDKKPTFSEAHNNLGRVYIDTKDFHQARIHLFKAAGDLTYPHKDKVWLNIGLSYFQEGQYDEAKRYFLKSISANRNNCLAYNFYGRTLVETEQFKDAAQALDQAIVHCKDKGLDEPHYFGAIALFRMGFKQKAIARLQEGKKLFPHGPYRKKIAEMIELMKITETK